MVLMKVEVVQISKWRLSGSLLLIYPATLVFHHIGTECLTLFGAFVSYMERLDRAMALKALGIFYFG